MKASPQRVACRYMRAVTQGLSGFLGKYVYKRYRNLVEIAVAATAERFLEIEGLEFDDVVDYVMSSNEVVRASLYRAEFDDALEDRLLESINRDIPHNPVGPWSFRSTVEEGGVLLVHYMFAGEEVDAGTEHPGDTHEQHIQNIMKFLGASSASCRWSLDRTPRSWGFDGGDKFVVAYEGRAQFELDSHAFLLAGIGLQKIREEIKGVEVMRREASKNPFFVPSMGGYAIVPKGTMVYKRPQSGNPSDLPSGWHSHMSNAFALPSEAKIQTYPDGKWVVFGTWGGVSAVRYGDLIWTEKSPTPGRQ